MLMGSLVVNLRTRYPENRICSTFWGLFVELHSTIIFVFNFYVVM